MRDRFGFLQMRWTGLGGRNLSRTVAHSSEAAAVMERAVRGLPER